MWLAVKVCEKHRTQDVPVAPVRVRVLATGICAGAGRAIDHGSRRIGPWGWTPYFRMSRTRAAWTAEEDDHLRQLAEGRRSIRDIARALKRTPAAVAVRGRRIGLELGPVPRPAHSPLRQARHRRGLGIEPHVTVSMEETVMTGKYDRPVHPTPVSPNPARWRSDGSGTRDDGGDASPPPVSDSDGKRTDSNPETPRPDQPSVHR